MYRVFLSHSRRDNSAAQALFQWLTEAEPSLKGEIFLDVTPRTGCTGGALEVRTGSRGGSLRSGDMPDLP